MANITLNFLSQVSSRPRYALNAARNLNEVRTASLDRTGDPIMLQIEVTNRCNFSCRYCLLHNGS